MKIIWNKVTRFSQVVAVMLFVGVFFLALWIGGKYERVQIVGEPVTKALFTCEEGKSIKAEFYKHFVHIELSGRDSIYLPQTISASGARYANDDESLVFWNKGDTAFVTEGDPNVPTYKNCQVTE
jgi:membrane-bound inhibitor of C-type lysozyme